MNSQEVIQALSTTSHHAASAFVIERSDERFDSWVPLALRDAGAAAVAVSTNQVVVVLSALPRRYLLAFRVGAAQYGDERIADGLWFSTGPLRGRNR